MRGRYTIEQEVGEAMRVLTKDGDMVADVPRLLQLMLEVLLDTRDLYSAGHRPGIEA